MDWVLLFFAYFSYLFVLISYAVKGYKYFTAPLHLRWEIYPIPHERREGGYLQELKWYEKPRRISFISDLWFHIKDYIFMTQYFERNRGYWGQLYLFHLGLCSIFLLQIILGIVGFIALAGISTEKGVFLYVPVVFGAASFILGPIGSIGILLRRALDSNLKHYATPQLYFNYCFLFMVFFSGLIAWVFFDPTLSSLKEFYKGFVSFTPVLPEPATIVFLLLLFLHLIYLPYTRTFHYVTKFFNYFWIQWNDKPNLRGSLIEKKVMEQLNYKVTWSGPHVQTGKKWAEVAMEMPEEIKK